MQDHEKSLITLAIIGAFIAVGQVLVSDDPITARLFFGRVILGSTVSMMAGVALVQFPELSPIAINGIGCALGIAGYQAVERYLRRRGSKIVEGNKHDAK